MKLCFLFGHADAPDTMISKLDEAIEICCAKGIEHFYVGNRGRFDRLAAAAVNRAKQRHPQIRLFLLLAYHPGERPVDLQDGFDGSYYPFLQNTPKRYTIVQANQQMIAAADTVICYVCHIGNARNLLDYARRKQKKTGLHIKNLGENIS